MESHLYKFEDDKNTYECEMSLREAEEMGYPDKGIDTWLVTLENLEMKDNTFIMTYDYGTNYKFVIEILEQMESKENFRSARVIDGVGYGIVEDGRDILEDYLDGKPLEHPLLFVKGGKRRSVDFNSFDVEECNKKLKRDLSKIRCKYFIY